MQGAPGLPSSDSSQGQAAVCVPAISLSSGDVDWMRFEFPGVKTITLGESGPGAVWWCSCSDDLILHRSLFEALSRTAIDRSFLAGLAGQCYHLKVLLRIASTLGLQIEDLSRRQAVLSPAVRVAELEIDTEAEGERLVSVSSIPLPWSGKDGLPTVLVGCASKGYAVVRRTSRGTLACTSCSGSGRIKCWHVQAQVEEASALVPPSKALTAAEFEERLKRALSDLSTGMRRLTCLSRVRVEEPHLIGPELADILKRRGTLELRFPPKCSIKTELPGVQCGCGRSWEAAEKKWVSGTIFHLTAPVSTEVEEWACLCGGKKHYDGASVGLLNFSNVYLFSYELLNWPVGEPEEVTADGVLLGFNSSFSYLVQPWASPASEPLVSGSLHTERILVKAAPARQLLLRFSKRSTTARGAGLDDAKYAELRKLLQSEEEASVLCFLVDAPLTDKDRHFARPEVREFLHAVESSAPTCSLLPSSVFAVVENHLLQHGHIADFESYQLFASNASVLHSLILALQKRAADGKLDRTAVDLLRAMLAVARRAFKPAVQRSPSQAANRKEPALSEHPELSEFSFV
ncbi:hypothetical protein KFL_005850050 [Klebsormidium nitens]|uniref:HMG domain-containing protein n=1 Tax=Klebsormidium nitens TaxID=105231 RepID=A0A1Y1ILG8_KLENI|nr:hypothetical protein KFL_005850050 [Klebsormidium nitens]|eukprot:GAQ89981.1 hypothetical protein KFL_005850050 [Klebsormidium nitens]